MKWYSLHLFYYDKQDIFISECVYRVLNNYDEHHYFFIRYWEGGPHIRLRIKSNNYNHILYIAKSIRTYMSRNPSKIKIDKKRYISNMMELYHKECRDDYNFKLYSNNTVIFQKYIPETKKYLGKEGVSIAENEFIYSSRLALKFIQSNVKKSQKCIISSVYAKQLLDCFYSSNSEKLKFLKNYLDFWENFEGDSLNDYFKSLFVPSNIVNNLENILNQCNNKKIHANYLKDINKQYSYVPYAYKIFLFNFIHLFNNRLGLVPKDEMLIANITRKYYEKIY